MVTPEYQVSPAKSNADILKAFGGLDDDEWISILVSPPDDPRRQGQVLPGSPDIAVQQRVHGTSHARALLEAHRFIAELRGQLRQNRTDLASTTRVLDFGCGYGRMLSLISREVSSENLHGADVDASLIQTARELNPYVNFVQVPSAPPTGLPDCFFDVIYAYSVFSHINEATSLAWIQEFSRILKPGGFLMVTTQRKDFILLCERIRRYPWLRELRGYLGMLLGRTRNKDWENALRGCFIDVRDSLKRYDDGVFLFEPTGGGGPLDSSFYGEAVISPGYVRRAWGQHLDYVDFIDDAKRLPQALIVLKKPS